MSDKQTLQENNETLNNYNIALENLTDLIDGLPAAILKPSNRTQGNLMAFDSIGNARDSGIASSDVATKQYVADMIENNFGDGSGSDIVIDTSNFVTKPSSSEFTPGNIVIFDNNGNIIDSGLKFEITENGGLRVTYDDGQ